MRKTPLRFHMSSNTKGVTVEIREGVVIDLENLLLSSQG